MMRSLLIALWVFVPLCLSPVRAETVTVFAAASLKTALDEIVEGTDTTISYAASSTLARQIALGAPADIVMTANADWIAYLEAEARIEPQTRVDLLGNELVLIASAEVEKTAPRLDAIIGDHRIAMALVDAVPAGIYGKEALAFLGLWPRFAPNVVQTDNVRAALRLVASGQVPFGIVYVTDARAEARVRIIHRFHPSQHQDITYPMAIVAGKDRPAVRALWTRLQSPAAGDIFRANGFIMKAHRP
ncbi:MAG: molybdate ABC transporter substrate-binding protein [Pseudomonadota bacterium]